MSETNTERLKAALNLDREPFSDEGVAGLFFPGGDRQALVDQLMHLCRYGSPLLVLLGDNGVGKSAVVRQLEARFDPSVFQHLHIEADVLADENLILQRLAEGFQLDIGRDLEAAIESIIRYARELDGFSQTPLIIVDEAQNLSASAIEFLVHLLSQSRKSGLHCLLAMDGARPEKIPLLAPVVNSELDHQLLEVPPLDAEAIDEYVDYRMTTSGLSDIQFSPEQKRQIRNQSMGNIDRINMVARQILVEYFPYERNRKKPVKLPFIHVAVVVLLGVLLLAAYYWIPQFPAEVIDAESESLLVDVRPDKRVTEKTVSDIADAREPAIPSPEAEVSEPEEALDGEVEEASEEAVEEELDTFVAEKAAVDFNYAEDAAEEDLLQPVTSAGTQESGQDASGEGGVATVKPDTEIKKPDKQAKPSIASASDIAPAASGLSAREKWLMSLDKSQFTLQMLGATEEASVQKFLARYPSLKEIAYYRTTHRDQDWYVVVYGLYASKESAKQALSKLPKPLRESGPWARSIASVQEEIKKR